MSAFDAFLMDCVNDCIEGGAVSDPWPEEPPADWPRDEYDPDLPYTWPDDERLAWKITNDKVADWALGKYARAEQEIQRLTELAEFEIAGIRERLASATSTPEHDIEFFGARLTDYHQRLQDEGVAGKTYKLLNGDLTSRLAPERAHVFDTDLVYSHDETLCRVKVEPDKRAILERLKTGEQIPGAELVPGETSYKPKVGKHEQPAWMPIPDAEAA